MIRPLTGTFHTCGYTVIVGEETIRGTLTAPVMRQCGEDATHYDDEESNITLCATHAKAVAKLGRAK